MKRMKRKIRFLTAITLILSLILSVPGMAAVKEAGSISDAKEEYRTYSDDGPLYKYDGDLKVFCDADGKEFPELTFVSAEKLVDGIWLLNRQGEETPESCAISEDGTMLIPWGLNVISAENEYFLDVITGEEVTENQDEALMYVSPNMFTIIPGEDDVLFKGTRRLYDIAGKKMLEDHILTNLRQSFEVVGSSYKVDDRENTPQILNANGDVLAEDASTYNVDSGYYYLRDNGVLKAFDDHLEVAGESEQADGIIGDGYFYVYDDEYRYGLISFDGKTTLESISDSVPRITESGAIITVEKTEDNQYQYGLIDNAGNVILEPKYYSVDALPEGYVSAKEHQDDDHVTLLGPDGKVLTDQVKNYNYDLCFETPDGEDYIVLQTGQPLGLKKEQQARRIGTALLSFYDTNSRLYGVCDLRDGSQILKTEWEDIQAAYGRIYALKNGVWHVFEQ